MRRLYFYKLTNDGGGAPCVQGGLLSLAICKPKIRVGADLDDVIFGYTANSLDPNNRLIYIARVTHKASKGGYFTDKKYSGRCDCIYEMQHGRFVRKKDALYHDSAGDLVHDLGSPPKYPKAEVLLSSDFRYFGADGTAADDKNRFPKIKDAFEALGRGHRVHHDEPLRIELESLMNEEWTKTSRKVLGQPTTGPRRDACYRDVSFGMVLAKEPDGKC